VRHLRRPPSAHGARYATGRANDKRQPGVLRDPATLRLTSSQVHAEETRDGERRFVV